MLGKLSSEPRGIQKVFTNDLFFRKSRRLARYVEKKQEIRKENAVRANKKNTNVLDICLIDGKLYFYKAKLLNYFSA